MLVVSILVRMDQIDREIVEALDRDARVTATELAATVGLSVSSAAERLRRLLAGAVEGFDVRLDRQVVGRPIDAFLQVKLRPSADIKAVNAAILEHPCVIDAKSVTGGYGYLLRIAAHDTSELDDLINTLRQDLGAAETATAIVLNSVDGFPRPVAFG